MMNAIETLREIVQTSGPIPAARVSSARAKGRAKTYPYWGVAEYEIRLRKDGVLTAVAKSRARSDRRSLRLAKQDAEEIAKANGWVVYRGSPGPVGEISAIDILGQIKK